MLITFRNVITNNIVWSEIACGRNVWEVQTTVSWERKELLKWKKKKKKKRKEMKLWYIFAITLPTSFFIPSTNEICSSAFDQGAHCCLNFIIQLEMNVPRDPLQFWPRVLDIWALSFPPFQIQSLFARGIWWFITIHKPKDENQEWKISTRKNL